MDITVKYAIFAIGALIIIGILWHAFSKAPKQPPQQVLKPAAKTPGAKPAAARPAPLAVKKTVPLKKPVRIGNKPAQTEPTLGRFQAPKPPAKTAEKITPVLTVAESQTEADEQRIVPTVPAKEELVLSSETITEFHEPDIAPEIQEELDRAAEEALAASRGEPHQVELPFEDQEATWEDVVKTTFEKRMQKMPEGVPDVMHMNPEPAMPPQHHAPINEFVVLNVIAPRSTIFHGPDIIDILEQQGMSFGQHGIYHSYAEDGKSEFGAASVMEPGYFDLSTIQQFKTPGLTFFMDLARVQQPKTAFKRMLTVVHEVSRRLGGDILDEQRQRLTQASVTEYLARIKGVESRRKAYG